MPKDVQAIAKSLNFVSSSGEAYNVTRVYRSVADAEHAFAGLSNAARRTCVAKDGTAMSIGEVGDERAAFRSIIAHTNQGLTNYLISDLRIVRVNRSVVVLSFAIYRNGAGIRFSVKPTANGALESKLTTVLVDRLVAGLYGEADTRVAEKSSLRSSDFPTGWEQKKTTGVAGRSACAFENAKDAADATAGSEFESTHVGADEVGGYENVYRSVAEAEFVFAKLTSQANRSCIANFTVHEIPSTQTVTFGNVTSGQVSIGEIGDQRAAWRLTQPVNTSALSVDSISDYRFVRVGRGIAYLLFSAVLKPIDEGLQSKLTTALVDRLKAGLASGA